MVVLLQRSPSDERQGFEPCVSGAKTLAYRQAGRVQNPAARKYQPFLRGYWGV